MVNMADTGGKKGKKKKGKTLNLNDFLSEGGKAPVIVPAPKSWADEMEDAGASEWGSDNYMSQQPAFDVTKLPTAPKASLDNSVDPSRLPTSPPFTAYIGSLPYEVTEEEIADFFHGLKLVSIRLPGGLRQKGFGYAEFEDLDSLKKALELDNEMIQNRQIKVDVAGHSSHMGGTSSYRDGGNQMDGYGGFQPDRTNHDWRQRESKDSFEDGPRQDRSDNRYPPRDDYGRGDRGFGRSGGDGFESRGGYGREQGFGRESRGFGGDDRGFGREDRGFGRDDRGGWGRDDRGGFSGRDDRGGFGGRDDRGGFGGRDDRGGFGGRDDRGGFGGSDRGYGRDGRAYGREDRSYGREDRGYGRDDRGFGRSNGDGADADYNRPNGRDRPESEMENWRSRAAPSSQESAARVETSDAPREDRDHASIQTRESDANESGPRERKKLNLKPRTAPTDAKKEVTTSAIFGGARPVDTSTKEKEIEERLAKLRVENDSKAKVMTRERHNSHGSVEGEDKHHSPHHGKEASRKPRTSSKSDAEGEGDKGKVSPSKPVPEKEVQAKPKRPKGTAAAAKYEEPKVPVFSTESMYSILADEGNSDGEAASDDQE